MNVPSRGCAGRGPRGAAEGARGQAMEGEGVVGKSSERRDAKCGAESLRDALRS